MVTWNVLLLEETEPPPVSKSTYANKALDAVELNNTKYLEVIVTLLPNEISALSNLPYHLIL